MIWVNGTPAQKGHIAPKSLLKNMSNLNKVINECKVIKMREVGYVVKHVNGSNPDGLFTLPD